MQKKIFRSSFLTVLTVLIVLYAALAVCLYRAECEQLRRSLAEEAKVVASLLGEEEASKVKIVASSRRVTLIATDGSVLFDSSANAEDMENHLNRREIAEAMAKGSASITRQSDTLSQEMAYYALRLPSGGVLRLAAEQRSVLGHMIGYLPFALIAFAACLLLTFFMSRRLTARLVAPIQNIDPARPLDNDCYEEISPLLRRLYEQQTENARQMDALRAQTERSEALLAFMREGLMMLDGEERIVSLNAAARDILGAGETECVGRTPLELSRSMSLQTLIEQSRQKPSATGAWEKDGKHYRVSVSQLRGSGERLMLLLDDTAEHEEGEMRRQFTANVSHELRTPLTAISGYAELLESGMVKPEDEQGCVARIRTEAARMLTLVEDILRLSQLDEGSVALNDTDIDLMRAAEDTARLLSQKAAARQIDMTVTGGGARVNADPTLLSEILYNIIENAVKYNRVGGEVEISVGTKDGRAYVSVRDSGIGIPKDQQSKVFERFYRVDKSRSKETGGTGLGLSIVKHAARLLRADVRLMSEENMGTTVTVLFGER